VCKQRRELLVRPSDATPCAGKQLGIREMFEDVR
jgi:hypothetical protein